MFLDSALTNVGILAHETASCQEVRVRNVGAALALLGSGVRHCHDFMYIGRISYFNLREFDPEVFPYEREDLVFEIALNVSSLSHKMENNPENIEKIIHALEALHRKKKLTIDSREALRKRFKERVDFESDLLKMREKINEIKIVFSEPSIKRSFLKLLGEKR